MVALSAVCLAARLVIVVLIVMTIHVSIILICTLIATGLRGAHHMKMLLVCSVLLIPILLESNLPLFNQGIGSTMLQHFFVIDTSYFDGMLGTSEGL